MPHDHDDHDHAHGHHHHGLSPSGHPYRPDDDTTLSRFQVMEIALRELLIEKGIATAPEIMAQVERMDARAWTDSAFKARLLADGSAACREMGIEVDALKLVVVENTPQVHNVVVCTLCSCYPRNLLGLPPDWYKTRAYRSRVVREPRAVLAEFGTHLPDDVRVQVHDSTADMRYLVLPARPAGTDGWSAERLAELVGRDAMIGVTLARAPEEPAPA